MPAVCNVRGCKSVRVKGSRNVQFHQLPKDAELRKKWLTLSDINKSIKHVLVCSRHFESTAFERNLKYELLGLPVPPGKRKFKPGAVPTLHLPNLRGQHTGTATWGTMEPSTESVPAEVKEEPTDNQVTSSHLPSSTGVDRVRDADRNSHLMMNPIEDRLKVAAKEEPFDDHTYATLPPSFPQQGSGVGRVSDHPEHDLTQCGGTDIKEEDVWIKDEPLEDSDLMTGNTTTFTPKPGSTGITWCRASAASLLELVRRRSFLWDFRHPLHHKIKLRQEALDAIAEELRMEHPELSRLNGAQVRVKFKNLRTYFLACYNKIKNAPSGSEGCPGKKWPLFDSATFLIDSLVEQTPTESSFTLPPTQTSAILTNGDDGCITEQALDPDMISSDDSLRLSSSDIQPSQMPRNHISLGTCSLLSTEPCSLPSPVPSNQLSSGPSSHPSSAASSRPSSAASSLPSEETSQKRSTSHKAQRRVKAKKHEQPVDNVLQNIDCYLATKREANKFASAIGQMAESAAEKMPYNGQLHFMEKILAAIKDVNCAIAAGEYQTQEK